MLSEVALEISIEVELTLDLRRVDKETGSSSKGDNRGETMLESWTEFSVRRGGRKLMEWHDVLRRVGLSFV